MATTFSFTVHKRLTEQQKADIKRIIGSSLLRSEEWYKEGAERCRYKNKEQHDKYVQDKELCYHVSLVIGATGENISTE